MLPTPISPTVCLSVCQSFSFCLSPYICTEKKVIWWHNENVTPAKLRREASPEINPDSALILDFQHLRPGKKKKYCLRCLLCGIDNRTNIAWSHLYEITKIAKLIVWERLEIIRSWEDGVTRVSVWDNEKTLERVVMVTQRYEHSECHLILHLRTINAVNFVIFYHSLKILKANVKKKVNVLYFHMLISLKHSYDRLITRNYILTNNVLEMQHYSKSIYFLTSFL